IECAVSTASGLSSSGSAGSTPFEAASLRVGMISSPCRPNLAKPPASSIVDLLMRGARRTKQLLPFSNELVQMSAHQVEQVDLMRRLKIELPDRLFEIC